LLEGSERTTIYMLCVVNCQTGRPREKAYAIATGTTSIGCESDAGSIGIYPDYRYQIIPPEMFQTDHLTHAYDMDAQPNAHKLACVFLVMAIGVMFDLHRPPCKS
jgi:hypothetical protein